MRRYRTRVAAYRTRVAATGIIAALAVIAFVALLPRSDRQSAKLLVRGTTRTAALNALDVNGTSSSLATTQASPTTSIVAPPATPGQAPQRPSGTTTRATAAPPIIVPTTLAPITATTVAPVASPATGRLAVTVMSSADGSTGPDGIATMAANGSNRQVLITGTYNDPQWTPDGRFIVFQNFATDAILAIPAGGGLISHLGTATSAAAPATWWVSVKSNRRRPSYPDTP